MLKNLQLNAIVGFTISQAKTSKKTAANIVHYENFSPR